MLTEIETRAMEMLLAGDDERLTILRAQLDDASVTERLDTESGFYTHFGVPAASPRLPDAKHLVIDDVSAKLAGFKFPVGFLLFVNDGAIDMLECFSVGDDGCPRGATIERAYYVRPAAPGSPMLTEAAQRHLRWALGDNRPSRPPNPTH
jgi:hypothetical protein